METAIRKFRSLLRMLMRPPGLVFGLLIPLLLITLLLAKQHRIQSRVSSSAISATSDSVPPDSLSETISRQLRADQGELSSIGQHIFNAYFDTRSTLGGRKFARVISVLDTNAYSSDFICQFMDGGGHLSFSSVARKSKIGAGMSHGNHYYQEFVLSCPIPGDLASAAFLFIQTHDASLRSQVIRVRHNPLSLGEKPSQQQLVINCVSVTFGAPSEHRLIEWVEAQRLLKVDKVQLHFYNLRNKQFEAVAQAFSAEGILDVRRIACPFCEAGHEEWLGLLLMSPVINQCFYENLGRYKFTAVFDLDEVIVPQQHPDYPSMLTALEAQINTSSFAFRNWYHFAELGEDAAVSRQLYMLRHPFRTKEVSPEGYSTKSIHRSDCVVALHNHFSWEDVPAPGTLSGCHHVALSVGVLEHYKKCHFDQVKCREMTRVKDRQDGSRLNQLMGRELAAASALKMELLFGRAVASPPMKLPSN